ncbi:MAG: hypothetical protein LC659_02110 [Myxococcales bacterium]|nr:hypothetical protein [Myxococcales bacterium]
MSCIAKFIRTREKRLVRDWIREQSTRTSKSGVSRDSELRANKVVDGDGTTIGLVSHYGAVGGDLRKVHEQRTAFVHSDGLLPASDGVRPKWHWSRYPLLWRRDPPLVAGVVYRGFAAGRDDSTVVLARAA